MIRELFSEYVSQPIKNFYNYLTGKTSEEVDVHANLEGNASFVVNEHDHTTNEHTVNETENDIL